MFFPKKLTFLQYWVYQKQSSIESTNKHKNKKISTFQTPKNISKLATKPLRVRSLQRNLVSQDMFTGLGKQPLYRYDKVMPQPLIRPRGPNLPLTCPLPTIVPSQITLGNILAQPKPWYSYWILPFVGFITVLPNLTSFQRSQDSLILNHYSYGFKYLKPIEPSSVKATNIKGTNFEFMNAVPSGKYPSSLYRTTLTSVPKNLRALNTITTSPFFKPVWYRGGDSTNNSTKNSFYSSNSIKLSNGLNFNQQLASQPKTSVLAYKTLETNFDLFLKQLLFSKDNWFQTTFLTKTKFTGAQIDLHPTPIHGTTALLKNTTTIQQHTNRLVDEQNSEGSLPLSLLNKHSTVKNSVRFLASHQDALYFFTYISKTSLDPNIIKEKMQLFSKKEMCYFPVKSPLLTKLDYPNKVPALSNTFKHKQTQNENRNLTPTDKTWIHFKSYRQSLDHGMTKETQTEANSVRRKLEQTTINGNNSFPLNSKKVGSDISSVRSSFSSDSTIKKYIHYIKSRLISSLQLLKHRQDPNNNLQPVLSLNMLTPGTYFGNEPALSREIRSPKAILLPVANKIHKVKRPFFNHFNSKTQLTSPTITSQNQSIEKLIRNHSFYSVKTTKLNTSVGEAKKQLKLQPLNSKPLQTLLGNMDTKKSSKTKPFRGSELQYNNIFMLKALDKYTTRQNTSFLKMQKQFNLNVQPQDLLRIKHFVFLSNREKLEYKHYRTLNVILKDEKLLYETLIRQNQKQKRRKKKRKRWTRRRRKRKRKLLRPIWTTIHLAKVLNQRRLGSAFLSHKRNPIANQNFFHYKVPSRIFKTSLSSNSLSLNPLVTKDFYKLSKKSLVELTKNKRNKTHVKSILKAFEKVQVEKTKLSLRNAFSKMTKFNLSNQNRAKTELNAKLEYNRIMYERLQSFLINYGTNMEKNWGRDESSSLSLALAYSKINSLHTKIIQNAPKEEWLWLFKYITGELPSYPITSSTDELRSIWGMSKMQSNNQWTGWKNFYYQEFKKGITPTYELWQDKKPDKRYNVNNLKKRQYKHIKYLQRLRLAPQLHRGTYFALQRNLRKLTVLGSPYKKTKNFISDSLVVHRPIDKLRLTLKSLKTLSSSNSLKSSRSENNINYHEQVKKNASISQVITAAKKPILDLYATWWDTTEITGWGWKTLQYGAPWDRKTLYIPTKLTSDISLTSSPIVKQSFSFTNVNKQSNSSLVTFPSADAGLTTIHESTAILLVATLLLHICAFFGLLSLAEVRYTTKVNLILAYKLSTIPLKLMDTTLKSLFKKQTTNQETLLGTNRVTKVLKTEHLSLAENITHQKLYSSIKNRREMLWSRHLASTIERHRELPMTEDFTRTLNTYKFGFYGSIKQVLKKVLRHNNTQRQLSESVKENSNSGKAPQLRRNSISSDFSIYELRKLEGRKYPLQTSLIGNKLRRVGFKLSYSTYYTTINLIENIIDNFRDTTRSVYDFFSLPENFSPNPDEVGLDVLANFIYDFEEPLIELLPDIVETQTDKYLDRYLLTLSILGPFGLFVQQRCKWFYRMFVGLLYEADADYRKDEEELHILYTIWAEILNKAAEDLDLEASVIASQEDQRILLLEHLLVSNLLEQEKTTSVFRRLNQNDKSFIRLINEIEPIGNTSPLAHFSHNVDKPQPIYSSSSSVSLSSLDLVRRRRYKNSIERFTNQQLVSKKSNLLQLLSNGIPQKPNSLDKAEDIQNQKLRKSSLFNSQVDSTWITDQYVLYKTDETDLFLEINVPKSFATLPAIKHWDTLHQPIGVATCQIYSGILTKQMAKNILLIADNTAEKTQILQALAGETEVKLILDNSSRYSSISQSVAVGMRLLRDVFDAVALQTPCIFVLEDIHLIGEKRPFLISDEDLALVTNSGLGLEQHQLYEKIQKIQQHSKHRISYFKKAYRGDAPDSLPTNLLCYELFITDQPRTEWQSSHYPIPMDFHSDFNEMQQPLTKGAQLTRSTSHLLLSETHVSQDTLNTKPSHFVNESIWSTKFDENQQKNNTSSSLRGKVSSIADGALANISVKLDRITQLLVIMDNVRKNKGFIVFGTTNKPQILDPALRRPGRLEETIYLPSIPNILTKWEILNSQMKSSYTLPRKSGRSKITLDMFSVYCNLQKSSNINQNNLVLALAQCLQSRKKVTIQTPYHFGKKGHSMPKQKSILKMHFMNQLLTESKPQRSEISQIINLSSIGTQKTQSPNIRFKKFLNEIVGASYEQTAKFLFEIITHQTSSSMFLFKSAFLKNSLAHMEDTIYMKLYSGKELFKNELSLIFAGIIANYFANVTIGSPDRTTFSIKAMLDTTKNNNWQTATSLIYAYIQKRAIYNKNTYIQKLFNRHAGSITGFASPPTTTLLLPAKRYENYLRTERDYDQTSLSQRTLSVQSKIEFHLNQRVLKRLYRLPIKEFYKSEIIENSLTTFSSSNLVLPRNTRNYVQQNIQSKSNFYYRNIFLNRHRHYLTNQWWTGHLTEYNIENTVMSEIDFRSYFVDKTKVVGFTGDLILDFPDADQHYNLKHRRWYLQSTSWKSWYDFEKGLTTDIMNHYIVEVYTQTYRVLNSNRELLDNFVAKVLINYHLQEIDLISNLKRLK